ncbi:uncharacterized protein LOC144621041 [Crassostrea virginica]
MSESDHPDILASVVATHSSSRFLKEAFSSQKSFPLTLVKPSAMIKDGQVNLLPCKSIDECFNMFAPCSPSHLNLLAKVHGHLHLGHYVQQYKHVFSGGKEEEVYEIFGISGNGNLYQSFEDALANPIGYFRLLLLAGALEINISLQLNNSVIAFPPCPCLPTSQVTLKFLNCDGFFSLLVPLSSIAGYKSPCPETLPPMEKLRLPGMEKKIHRVEMDIDLYEADIESLHAMRWLTDAVIDVATRY